MPNTRPPDAPRFRREGKSRSAPATGEFPAGTMPKDLPER